jgi:hypothetical protein
MSDRSPSDDELTDAVMESLARKAAASDQPDEEMPSRDRVLKGVREHRAFKELGCSLS